MPKIKGMVTAVADHGGRYGICLTNKWFNGFGKCPVAKNDWVELEFQTVQKNGKEFRNIKNISIQLDKDDKKPAEKPTGSQKSQKAEEKVTVTKEMAAKAIVLCKLWEAICTAVETRCETTVKATPELVQAIDCIFMQLYRL